MEKVDPASEGCKDGAFDATLPAAEALSLTSAPPSSPSSPSSSFMEMATRDALAAFARPVFMAWASCLSSKLSCDDFGDCEEAAVVAEDAELRLLVEVAVPFGAAPDKTAAAEADAVGGFVGFEKPRSSKSRFCRSIKESLCFGAITRASVHRDRGVGAALVTLQLEA